jgi:hypothetical protein
MNQKTKKNISCGQKKEANSPETFCLSPYDLPDFPIFKLTLSMRRILLLPDGRNCELANIDQKIVMSTIEFLGLNCDRLGSYRYGVWKLIKEEIDKIDKDGKNELLACLQSSYMQFYTTVQLLISEYI